MESAAEAMLHRLEVPIPRLWKTTPVSRRPSKAAATLNATNFAKENQAVAHFRTGISTKLSGSHWIVNGSPASATDSSLTSLPVP